MALTFSDEEIVILIRLIDEFVSGTIAAKELTTEDTATITTVEQLLESMSSYDEDLAVLVRIRERILADSD